MSEASSGKSSQRRKYPTLTLEQAIQRAAEVYANERRSLVPPAVLMKHWGYSNPTSGVATSTVSALRQFGLLDDEGSGKQRRTGISDRAYAILNAPEHIRSDAIRDAAMEPPIHRLIWNKYGGPDTGSEEGFRWFLLNDLGFSPKGADDFMAQYRATIRFAGLDKPGVTGINERTSDTSEKRREHPDIPPWEVVAEEGEDVDTAWQANRSAAGAPLMQPPAVDVWRTSEGRRVEVPAPGPQPTSFTRRHAIPLPGGKQVVLEGEFPITEATWKQFMAVLDAFKPGLVDETPEPVHPPTPEEFMRMRPDPDQD